jgi:hypothetical protein
MKKLIEKKIIVDGGVYHGEVKNDLPHGKGIFIKKNYRYEGEYKDGIKEGHGKSYAGDKIFYTIYEGKFKKGNFHGFGTMTGSDGSSYKGEHKEGRPNGQGTGNNKKGKYVGEWKDGLHHGQGTFLSHDGWKYVGSLEKGMPNGKGCMNYKGKESYLGEWKDGCKHGYGNYNFSDGRIYVGEFENDKFRDNRGGTMFPNGDIYAGEHIDGIPNGRGVLTKKDGTKLEVHFTIKDGKLIQSP